MAQRLRPLLWMCACTAGLALQAQAFEASTPDGAWRLRDDGPQLQLTDGQGRVVKTLRAAALDGSGASAVSAIVHLPGRRSFVIAFATLAELWELSLDPAAEPVFNGVVHDYRMGEGMAEPGYLGVRRTRLPLPLAALAAGERGWVLGTGVDGRDLVLLQLDVRRALGQWRLELPADLARTRWLWHEGRLQATVADAEGRPRLRLDVQAARVLEPTP